MLGHTRGANPTLVAHHLMLKLNKSEQATPVAQIIQSADASRWTHRSRSARCSSRWPRCGSIAHRVLAARRTQPRIDTDRGGLVIHDTGRCPRRGWQRCWRATTLMTAFPWTISRPPRWHCSVASSGNDESTPCQRRDVRPGAALADRRRADTGSPTVRRC